MPRILKLREGRVALIGNALVQLRRTRRGECELVVEAAHDSPARVLPRGTVLAASAELPELTPEPVVREDDIPF